MHLKEELLDPPFMKKVYNHQRNDRHRIVLSTKCVYFLCNFLVHLYESLLNWLTNRVQNIFPRPLHIPSFKFLVFT